MLNFYLLVNKNNVQNFQIVVIHFYGLVYKHLIIHQTVLIIFIITI